MIYLILKILLVALSIWLLYKAKDGNWGKVLLLIFINMILVIVIRMIQ